MNIRMYDDDGLYDFTVDSEDRSSDFSLTEGAVTTINMEVISLNGTSRTYVVRVTRQSANTGGGDTGGGDTDGGTPADYQITITNESGVANGYYFTGSDFYSTDGYFGQALDGQNPNPTLHFKWNPSQSEPPGVLRVEFTNNTGGHHPIKLPERMTGNPTTDQLYHDSDVNGSTWTLTTGPFTDLHLYA